MKDVAVRSQLTELLVEVEAIKIYDERKEALEVDGGYPKVVMWWWCDSGGYPDKVQYGFGRGFLYQKLVGWVDVVSWAKNCSCASDICFIARAGG